jgi:hypothetical protein
MNIVSNAVVAIAVTTCSLSVYAKCASLLHGGESFAFGIPTDKLTSKLTVPYVSVAVTQDKTSSVIEQGIMCSFGQTIDTSFTFARGVKASARWDVSFVGIEDSRLGISIPPANLLSILGEVRVNQEKFAVSWHPFSWDITSPFLLVGVQHVSAYYRLWIPVGKYILAEEGGKKGITPYLGAGVSFWRDKPYSLSLKYEVYSFKPQVTAFTLGVARKF